MYTCTLRFFYNIINKILRLTAYSIFRKFHSSSTYARSTIGSQDTELGASTIILTWRLHLKEYKFIISEPLSGIYLVFDDFL